MQISKDKHGPFAKQAEQAKIDSLCQQLRETEPYFTGGLSDDQLKQSVKASVDQAHLSGLTSEADVARFVSLELTTSPGFYRHPEIATLLKNPDLPADNKMLALGLLPSQVWREILIRPRPMPDPVAPVVDIAQINEPAEARQRRQFVEAIFDRVFDH